MDFLLPVASEFIVEFARNRVDHPVHHALRQCPVISLVDSDITRLFIGQDVLCEVAV